jgi:hypothetical protein
LVYWHAPERDPRVSCGDCADTERKRFSQENVGRKRTLGTVFTTDVKLRIKKTVRQNLEQKEKDLVELVLRVGKPVVVPHLERGYKTPSAKYIF